VGNVTLEREMLVREWPIPEDEWLRDLDQWLADSCNEDDAESAICTYGDLRRLRTAHQQTREELAEAHQALGDCTDPDDTRTIGQKCVEAMVELAEARAEVQQLEDDVARYQDACRTGAQSLDEARAEVGRLRRSLQCAERQRDTYWEGFEQAEKDCDQARRDAVEAVRLAGLAPRDLGSDMADRVDDYRKAPDKKSAG
jgi:chromosome segregation ATPase